MSKGQGISINVIIIAAIALIILVILATLVIRAGGGLNSGTQCEPTGGTCTTRDATTGACPSSMTQDTTKGCTNDQLTNEPRICCRQI